MDKLKIMAAALLCVCACTKNSEPEYILEPDEILVVVKEAESGTKTVLSDNTKTSFSSGDLIRVFDNAGKSAIYKFRTKTDGGDIFQKSYEMSGFDKTTFASAFYPSEKLDTVNSNKSKFIAEFNDSTSFASNSFPKGAAPMVSFTKSGDKIEFSNCFAVLGVNIKYSSAPDKALKVNSINLSSTSSPLNGKFEFTSSGVTYISDGTKSMTLTGCDAAGALSTTAKRFYLAVPGITTSSEEMTVTVTPTTDLPFSGKFTAKNSGASSVLAKNYILNLNEFILNPVTPGSGSSYSVADWTQVDTIKVGQITVAKSEVTVAKNDSYDVLIYGVTKWESINATIIKGSGKFEIEKQAYGTPKVKYYLRIKGKAACTDGEIYINDTETNSGLSIYVTVTE